MNPIYCIALDPGTSMMKASGFSFLGSHLNFQHKHDVSYPSFFLVQDGIFHGQDNWALNEPEEYAGVVGPPVKHLDPNNQTRESVFYDTPKFPQAIFFTIANLLDNLNAEQHVTIWLALALPYMHLGKEQSIREMLTKHDWFVHRKAGIPRTITIDHVEVQPQSKCVCLDYVFQWDRFRSSLSSERGKQLLAQGPLYVPLFGSNSLEQGILTGRFDDMKMTSTFLGTFDLLAQIQQNVYEKIGVQVSQYEAMYEVFQTGSFQGYDFRAENRQFVDEFLSSAPIQDAMKFFLRSNPISHAAVLLSGGTVMYGAKCLRKCYDGRQFQEVLIAEDDDRNLEPVFRVRGGLEKFLIRHWTQWKRERGL